MTHFYNIQNGSLFAGQVTFMSGHDEATVYTKLGNNNKKYHGFLFRLCLHGDLNLDNIVLATMGSLYRTIYRCPFCVSNSITPSDVTTTGTVVPS